MASNALTGTSKDPISSIGIIFSKEKKEGGFSASAIVGPASTAESELASGSASPMRLPTKRAPNEKRLTDDKSGAYATANSSARSRRAL